MVEKNKVWPAVLISALVVLSAFFNGLYIANVVKINADKPVNVDLTKVATKEDLKVISDALNLGTTDSQKISAVYDELFQEDAWKSSALVLSGDELKDRDYKELKEWLIEKYPGKFADGVDTDYKDIDEFSVVVKDSDVIDFDVEDKDAVVTYDLKVYFEDKNSGDKVKKYITATVTIEDDEVETLSFEETY